MGHSCRERVSFMSLGLVAVPIQEMFGLDICVDSTFLDLMYLMVLLTHVTNNKTHATHHLYSHGLVGK